MKAEGRSKEWAKNCDGTTRKVIEHVNGPLLKALAPRFGYHDIQCIDILRYGAPLLANLPLSGNGNPLADIEQCSAEPLRMDRLSNNSRIVTKLWEDPRAADLLKMTEDDASKGRMSQPRLLTMDDIPKCNLTPRFCIEQGRRPNGELKLRAVDDFTKSLVNENTEAAEKLVCDNLDRFMATVLELRTAVEASARCHARTLLSLLLACACCRATQHV